VLAVLVAVAWPPLLLARQAAQPAAALATLALPEQLAGGWAASPPSLPDWQPSFQNPNLSVQREYSRNGEAVGVHVAWFQDQRVDRKLVSSENMLVTSQDLRWNQISTGQAQTAGVDGVASVRTVSLLGAATTLASAKPRLRVWQLYWVGDRFTRSDLLAKLYQALQVMRGHGDGGAVVLLYTAEDGTDAADARLTGFLSSGAGTLDGLLRAMRTP
jgi:EpsI family protein